MTRPRTQETARHDVGDAGEVADVHPPCSARRSGGTEARLQIGFTTRRAAVRADEDRMLLGRLEPSFTSAGQFALTPVQTPLPGGNSGKPA